MSRITWLDDLGNALKLFEALEPLRGSWEDHLIASETAFGVCTVCGHVGDFRVTAGEPPGHWRNLLEGMLCVCGLGGRMRLIWKGIQDLRAEKRGGRVHIFERYTEMYTRLEAAASDIQLTGSEYLGDGLVSGSVHKHHGIDIRHESMLDMSFASGSLDGVMHFDVLEHVPDHRQALKECRRVLKDGGVALFSLPFYPRLSKHIVRARVTAEGTIEHILKPAYHGNPVDSGGALVFFHPSLELWDDIKAAGFNRVQIGVGYDPAGLIVSNGCPFPDGHVWPVLFRAYR